MHCKWAEYWTKSPRGIPTNGFVTAEPFPSQENIPRGGRKAGAKRRTFCGEEQADGNSITWHVFLLPADGNETRGAKTKAAESQALRTPCLYPLPERALGPHTPCPCRSHACDIPLGAQPSPNLMAERCDVLPHRSLPTGMESHALGDCCHDVTTLHALNDYHERPRCASTTRRQLAAEPACSRRVTVPTKPGEDGYSRQVGEATTRRVKWAWGGPYGPSWRITLGLTPRHPVFTPPAAHQFGRADKHETVTREGIGITFL